MAKEKTTSEKYIESINLLNGLFMSTLTKHSMDIVLEEIDKGNKETALWLREMFTDLSDRLRADFPSLTVDEEK